MLESLREAGLRHVLYSSSCATYGGQHALPIDERAEQRPMSTYGFTKLAFERMLQDYARAHGFRGIALRYFNAAGADPEGELGEMHEPEPHFIPCALRVAAGADPVLRINGRDHPTPDGTCVRDYVHVDDLARGHLLALSALLDGGASGALNLGTGVGHSLREVVAAVERVTGRPVPVEYAPRRDGDPAYAVADPRRAAETLGWKAAYPGIETMVEHAWRWSRQGASGAGGQARAQDRAAAAAR
jgi:UDP-arabinose 4-epimerase